MALCPEEDSAEMRREENKTQDAELLNYVGNLLGIPFAGVVDLVGLVGNLFVITSMCRRRRRTSMLVIVLGLALADILLLALHLVFQVLLQLYLILPNIPDISQSSEPVKQAVWPLSMAVHTIGVLLTVLICAERWLAVCKPLKVRSILSVGRTRRCVVGIFVAGLLLNFPRWFEYHWCLVSEKSQKNGTWLGDAWVPAAEEHYYMELKTAFGRSFIYSTVYCMFLYEFTVYVAPIFSLTVMTTHMLVRLKKSQKFWDTMSTAQQREHTKSSLPICIVAIFIVCETPTMIINCMDAFEITINHVESFALACGGFLVVAKCALNLVAYSVYSSILKGDFKSIVKTFKMNAPSKYQVASRHLSHRTVQTGRRSRRSSEFHI